MNAEPRKHYVYYRCNGKGCCVTGLREQQVESVVDQSIGRIALTDAEASYIVSAIGTLRTQTSMDKWQEMDRRRIEQNHAIIELIEDYLDGKIDQAILKTTRRKLLAQRQSIERTTAESIVSSGSILNQVQIVVQIAARALPTYRSAGAKGKRRLLRLIASRLTFDGRDVECILTPQFEEIAKHRARVEDQSIASLPRFASGLIPALSALINDNPGAGTSLALRESAN
jgi:hypothetical protein